MDAVSKVLGAVPKAAKSISRRSRQSQTIIKPRRIKGDVVSLVRPNLQVREPPITPGVKSLLQKELFKAELAMTSLQPQSITDHLDTSMESFFNQRSYTLPNFNEYLMVLSHQGKIDEALTVIEKMKLMGLKPSSVSFIYLMRACAPSKDVETAERLFDKAIETCGDNNIGNLYTTLISVHATTGNVDYIESVMLEKQRKGCAITVVDYTCQMHAMLIAKKVKNAIALYQEAKNKVRPDEFFMTTALRACAKDSAAEQALTIWQDMEQISRFDSCIPYNEIIMALAKRKDYAEKAVEMWREMRAKGIVPDERTFNAVLTACTRMGDLNLAKEAVTDMKLHMIEMDKVRYALLMQVYAASCARMDESGRDMCIADTWELFHQYEKTGGKVDELVLNSLLAVHIQSGREAEVEGLIMPMFESYGVTKKMHTYRHLINFYKSLRKPLEVYRLWDVMHKAKITPDFFITNAYLETGFKFDDENRVVEALQEMKKIGGTPLYYLMKKMNSQKDLPRRVWVELQEFKHFYSHVVEKKFGQNYIPEDILERARR